MNFIFTTKNYNVVNKKEAVSLLRIMWLKHLSGTRQGTATQSVLPRRGTRRVSTATASTGCSETAACPGRVSWRTSQLLRPAFGQVCPQIARVSIVLHLPMIPPQCVLSVFCRFVLYVSSVHSCQDCPVSFMCPQSVSSRVESSDCHVTMRTASSLVAFCPPGQQLSLNFLLFFMKGRPSQIFFHFDKLWSFQVLLLLLLLLFVQLQHQRQASRRQHTAARWKTSFYIP